MALAGARSLNRKGVPVGSATRRADGRQKFASIGPRSCPRAARRSYQPGSVTATKPRMTIDSRTMMSASRDELQLSSQQSRVGPLGLVLRPVDLASRVVEQHLLGCGRLACDETIAPNFGPVVLVHEQDPTIVCPVMRRTHG